MNIIFNSLLVQLVKYDVHTTRKIKSIHAIFITYYYYIFMDDKASYWKLMNSGGRGKQCTFWAICFTC